MAYIAVDLKVVEVLAPAVARATGLSENRVLAGLVRLWHRCWSTEKGTVTQDELAGCFGPEGIVGLAGALCADFLERTPDGFRVRGAARYLRLRAAMREGGRKAASNLRRGDKSPRPSGPGQGRGIAGESPGPSPGVGSGPSPALTPSTEHRAPNLEDVAGADAPRGKAKKPTAPGWNELVEALCDDYADVFGGAKYPFGGRDGKTLKQLRAIAADDEELRARWRIALEKSRNEYQPGKVRTLQALLMRWAEYPTARAQ